MGFIRTKPSLSRFATLAMGIEVFLGLGALAGGSALVLGPRGEIIPLSLSALKGSPFETYSMPGLILFVVLGLGPLMAAVLVWLRHPLAPIAAIGVGVALLAWLTVEIVIIGYTNDPPLQSFYLLLGAAITVVGLGWLAEVGPSAIGGRRVD
jgi:hypothetical protein